MTQTQMIRFLWTVIGVLAVGLIAVTIIALSRAHAVDQARSYEQGDVASLKEQLRQAKASPTPVETPLQPATGNLDTPTPSPTATPKK